MTLAVFILGARSAYMGKLTMVLRRQAMKRVRRRINYMIIIIILAVSVFSIITVIRYNVDIRKAYNRLSGYQIESINTEFGQLSYIDEGTGEPVLISHGIFGGYDQGYLSLTNILGEGYRIIAPSRFGYPGSDLPSTPTPENQAKAYIKLLDELDVEKVLVITTSAGGASGIKMAIDYPSRVNGLVLLSSGMPTAQKHPEEISGMTGPPAPLVNDFPMWFVINHFGFAMNMMMASDVPDDFYETMLPVKPRKVGIKNDESITNLDMAINYNDYPVEKLSLPILLVHAKDDPLAKYGEVEKFIEKVQPRTAIFETGGHLITGHEEEVSKSIKSFIEEVGKITSNNNN